MATVGMAFLPCGAYGPAFFQDVGFFDDTGTTPGGPILLFLQFQSATGLPCGQDEFAHGEATFFSRHAEFI